LEEDEKRMRSEIDGRGRRGGDHFVDDKPVTYTLCVRLYICVCVSIYIYVSELWLWVPPVCGLYMSWACWTRQKSEVISFNLSS
jgi:hypothetical protein